MHFPIRGLQVRRHMYNAHHGGPGPGWSYRTRGSPRGITTDSTGMTGSMRYFIGSGQEKIESSSKTEVSASRYSLLLSSTLQQDERPRGFQARISIVSSRCSHDWNS